MYWLSSLFFFYVRYVPRWVHRTFQYKWQQQWHVNLLRVVGVEEKDMNGYVLALSLNALLLPTMCGAIIERYWQHFLFFLGWRKRLWNVKMSTGSWSGQKEIGDTAAFGDIFWIQSNKERSSTVKKSKKTLDQSHNTTNDTRATGVATMVAVHVVSNAWWYQMYRQ